MRRIILILLTASALNISAKAQGRFFPDWTFGIEWGWTAHLYSHWHNNFFSPEGYRVNSSGSDFIFKTNAEAYLSAGLNINSNWNIAMYLGIEGITDSHKAVPVSIRGTYFWKGNTLSDRWFTFLDIGSGVSVKRPVQEILTGKIGGGYRLSLSESSKLDFLMSIRMTYTHPDVVYYEEVIAHEKINRNDMSLGGISLGIAITL